MENISPDAKGICFRGVDPDTEWWHACSGGLTAKVITAADFTWVKCLSTGDYDELATSNVFGQFPVENDDILDL